MKPGPHPWSLTQQVWEGQEICYLWQVPRRCCCWRSRDHTLRITDVLLPQKLPKPCSEPAVQLWRTQIPASQGLAHKGRKQKYKGSIVTQGSKTRLYWGVRRGCDELTEEKWSPQQSWGAESRSGRGVVARLGRRSHVHGKGRRPTDSGLCLSGTGGERGR